VLAVDEKPQMQAIDRTAPILPVMPAAPARMTHDDGDRWFTAPEAVAYDMAGEVIDGPAGAPESGTPA
jgi:hypothetical protein